MIRQIWKVRNTEGDPPQKSPPATEEISATGALQNDESQRERTEPAMDGAEQGQPQDTVKSTAPSDKKHPALLGKSSGAPLSVCTYDPHSATLYALVEPSSTVGSASSAVGVPENEEESKSGAPPTTKALPGILQMPAALMVANSGAGAGPNEERKGEPAASHTAARDPSGSDSSSSGFSPLQDLNAAVALHDPFAHMKVGEETESSNQAPQMGQANCLRFSPTLSSDHVVITDNGKCASSFPPGLSIPR